MSRTDNFSKFVKKPKGAAIKEKLRQEKKKEKKERAEAIEAHFARKREEKAARMAAAGHQPSTTKPQGKFGKKVPAGKAAPAKKYAETSKQKSDRPVKTAGKPTTAPATKPAAGKSSAPAHDKDQMPLNKFVAHSGLCSRRDAATLIKDGKVTVNGEAVTDPGTRVHPTDLVKVNGKKATPSRNAVYILLNKPKDYITTAEDPQGRRTVLDLVKHATNERIYPVGRLDRNTSGVLLLTNDGDLAQKLAHPSNEVKKVYEVRLDRDVTRADLEKIAAGLTLEDGFIAPDAIAYADAQDKSIIGIEIHSGRNRIVRRIFEHLKYDVKGLDRVMYAGLTKKNVQRGKWRQLTEKEIRILKYMNQSFVKTAKK